MSRPSVFGLPHLSEDAVASFADGVLSPAASERARKHCAECSECAAAVREQRETAMMLRAAPAPSLPSGLLARLTGLPMSTSLPPARPTGIGPDGRPVLLTREPPAADDDQPGDRQFMIATVGVRPKLAAGRLDLNPSG